MSLYRIKHVCMRSVIVELMVVGLTIVTFNIHYMLMVVMVGTRTWAFCRAYRWQMGVIQQRATQQAHDALLAHVHVQNYEEHV